MLKILGIESSCDETGIALCTPCGQILGHALHSQIALHQAYGGVVPELAARDHIQRLMPLLHAVVNQSNTALINMDAIACTVGPGLPGALMTGSMFGAALAMGLNKSFIPIHHMEAHLLTPLIGNSTLHFPFTALLVSGGHTQLYAVHGLGQYELMGETLDDAAGEAFDKVAKMLGLPYPGGPALAKLAETGNPNRFALPRPMLHTGQFEFSFSGLKTAALTTAIRLSESPTNNNQTSITLNTQNTADLAASFQAAVIDVLTHKCIQALRKNQHTHLVISGGVGANQALRKCLLSKAQEQSFQVHFPTPELCTDNGIMVAFAGAMHAAKTPKLLQHKHYAVPVQARWALPNTRTNIECNT